MEKNLAQGEIGDRYLKRCSYRFAGAMEIGDHSINLLSFDNSSRYPIIQDKPKIKTDNPMLIVPH